MEEWPGTFRQPSIFGNALAISLVLGRLAHEKWLYKTTERGK